MLQQVYDNLDAAAKISLTDVVNNHILLQLIDIELNNVRDQLLTCTPRAGMEVEYAVIQQRLISLGDLKLFLKTVREELTPQPNTE